MFMCMSVRHKVTFWQLRINWCDKYANPLKNEPPSSPIATYGRHSRSTGSRNCRMVIDQRRTTTPPRRRLGRTTTSIQVECRQLQVKRWAESGRPLETKLERDQPAGRVLALCCCFFRKNKRSHLAALPDVRKLFEKDTHFQKIFTDAIIGRTSEAENMSFSYRRFTQQWKRTDRMQHQPGTDGLVHCLISSENRLRYLSHLLAYFGF